MVKASMYWRYLKNVLRHKWFVFVECCRLGIPWLGVIHDLSKFLPSEFIPYTRYFSEVGGGMRVPGIEKAFDEAWLHHQHRNKHHWQRWLLTLDSARSDGKLLALPMPDRYRREMLNGVLRQSNWVCRGCKIAKLRSDKDD